MIRWLIMACSLNAACLSIPAESSGSAGCDNSNHTATPFVSGPSITIQNSLTGDLNGDGCTDLLLADVNEVGGFGIYVFLGPQPANGALQYHQFVETNALPLALTIASTSAGSDLLVLGPRPDSSAGLVEIFAIRETAETLVIRVAEVELSFVPEAGVPASIVAGDFTDAGNLYDVAAADLYTLAVYALESSVTELSATVPIIVETIGGGPAWTDINRVLAVPNSTGGDDLAVVQQASLSWFEAGALDSEDFHDRMDGMSMRSAQQIDLDGVPPLDIVGGAFDEFGAYLAAGEDPVVISEAPSQGMDSDDIEYQDLLSLSRAEGFPDLVAFERGDTPELIYLARAHLVGTQLQTNAPIYMPLEGIDPFAGEAADLDADGFVELRLFGRDGTTRCFSPDGSNDTLVLCP